VIADPAGRVFCGTMPSPDHLGALYRLDADGEITKVLDGIGCSNGMGF
jgi:D-xylonolactonase